jgi:hypothetical protein
MCAKRLQDDDTEKATACREGMSNIEQGISNEEGKKEKTTDPRVLPRGRNG